MKQILTQLINNHQIIAKCSSSVVGKIAYINHLVVVSEYRKNKVGSLILNTTEKTILLENDINEIQVVVWQPQGDYLLNFFEKNGYQIISSAKETLFKTYDNGDIIYNLVPMFKTINK